MTPGTSAPVTRAFWLWLPLFAVALAVAIWNPAQAIWSGVEPPKAQVEAYDAVRLKAATVVSSDLYDSRKLDRWMREPQNTVSNLAYMYVGLAVCLASRRVLSRSFGVACIFLGLGSGLYHASLLAEWRMLDILGVYAALFGLCGLGVTHLLRQGGAAYEKIAALLLWFGAFVSGIFRNDVRIAGFKPLDSTTVVVACVAVGSLCALLSGWRLADRRRYLRALAVLIVAAPIAFFGGYADRFGGLWAAPEAIVQGHAVWHTLGAVSLLAAYEVFAAAGFDASVFRSDVPARA
jgi:hypothetical protein